MADEQKLYDNMETEADREAAQEERQNADLGHSLDRDGLPETFSADDLEFLSAGEREELAAMKADEDEMKPGGEELPESTAAPDKAAAPAETLPQPPDTSEQTARLAEVDAKIRELRGKYTEADIGDDEFEASLDALIEQKSSIKAEIQSITREAEKAQEAALDLWYSKVESYMKQHPDLGTEAHIAGFDAELRKVTGPDGPPNLTWDQQIVLAHKRYAADAEIMGKPLGDTPPQAVKASTQQQPAREELKPRTDPRPQPPRTLAHVPASGEQSAIEGKASSFDRAIDNDPFAAEDMLASMSSAEVERILSGL